MPSETARPKALDYTALVVGMVVTTIEAVTIYNKFGKADGKALPGWKWKITRVRVHPANRRVTYEVTAPGAPGMYQQCLKPNQIAKVLL